MTWSQAIDHIRHITLMIRQGGWAGMAITGAPGVAAGVAPDGIIVPGLGATGITNMGGTPGMDGTRVVAIGSVGARHGMREGTRL
jgi:hypothetical protein